MLCINKSVFAIVDIKVIITNLIADDKPAVVVTHGDRLSLQQRAHVQNELVELLGIPLQQIFDIPGIAPSCF